MEEKRANESVPEHATPPLISARDLSKSFGNHRVLRNVSVDIHAGEIVVLLGPNGAGKSTFLNLIGGTLQPSSGTMAVDGNPIDFEKYVGASGRSRGIQRVFQELSTFANLTVAENLALTSDRGSLGSRREMARRARERLQVFPGNKIDVGAEVAGLSIAERQMIEIARAMTEPGTRLVILDEPTSALSSREADQLADLVTRKAAEGVSIIYVTHKLEEAIRLAHRVVVLRDGKLHFDGDGRNLTHDKLLSMLGATAAQGAPVCPRSSDANSHELLTVQALSSSRLHDVAITVGAGEIVGIAGLEGAGQRELLQAIFSARKRNMGAISSSTDIAYVSGDRKREGLLPLWTVQDNVAISAAPRLSSAGFVDFAALKTAAQTWLSELGLAHRAQSPITSLSGGNQQRALLGRALVSEAPLLLLDDPTRGVDASAKASIYEILDKLKEKGRSAILYSTEVAEFQKCDRVYVMARGHIVAEFDGTEATEERIIQASFLRPGVHPSANAASGRAGPVDPPAKASLAPLLAWRSLPAAILMLTMFALAIWQQPNAFSTFGLELLLQASLPLAFAVMAQMLFLLGGDIDLGLGFAIGLVNVLAATYLVDAPAVGVVALGLVIGGYVALALVVELLGVSSVVATLGASFVWLGTGLIIRETPGGQSPEWLTALANIKLWPLPLACYVLVAVALVGLWICQGWGYSIRLRALGHNRRIFVSLGFSALAGRITIYALAGLFAVLSGLLLTATTGAGNVHVASSFTLATVAAVVVGGASFSGGIVSPIGAVMAVIGISLVATNLTFLGISPEYSTAIGGLILILALSFRSLARSIEP
ncbi:inner-membrane translocator (plasmid) [Sinorhizobium meliloti]|uniref:ATP-binding cassette domain-containing protein n=1 Tax=Rhizobium meliloti TaxID=382 RepID=UPI000B4A296F|nr:ATP-binding cassette domain-containing protein [Sinorhizobium meliloti]ASP74393.1 inner-membrane translocator [Sinorhizobium meliloti]MDE3857483.1 ATP-binding cassette domain-containing protein [Sinorhizobium meliloti]MQW49633.1 ATP-binding cassette domain-containing protein [Sinorhizobium meliloti]MQW49684.1 ATP-binding cassette domain-containing protein [Sinorhizobium meliloti]RVI62034.1 ABC transporter ATP-binding protein [Sinorhizobium meliloti]